MTPWSWGTRGLQAGSALLAAGVAAALAALLRRRGGDPRQALWWAWCPAVVAEAGNGAHVDVLAAAFVVAALAAVSLAVGGARRGRAGTVLAGVMTGLATLVKLYPAVVLSSLFSLRHSTARAVAAVAAAVLTVLLAYLPHWLAAGHLVLGYLPAYVVEESGSNRSGIVQLLLPDALVTPATIGLLAIVAGAVAWSRVRDPALGSHARPRLAAPPDHAELPLVRPAARRLRRARRPGRVAGRGLGGRARLRVGVRATRADDGVCRVGSFRAGRHPASIPLHGTVGGALQLQPWVPRPPSAARRCRTLTMRSISSQVL